MAARVSRPTCAVQGRIAPRWRCRAVGARRDRPAQAPRVSRANSTALPVRPVETIVATAISLLAGPHWRVRVERARHPTAVRAPNPGLALCAIGPTTPVVPSDADARQLRWTPGLRYRVLSALDHHVAPRAVGVRRALRASLPVHPVVSRLAHAVGDVIAADGGQGLVRALAQVPTPAIGVGLAEATWTTVLPLVPRFADAVRLCPAAQH